MLPTPAETSPGARSIVSSLSVDNLTRLLSSRPSYLPEEHNPPRRRLTTVRFLALTPAPTWVVLTVPPAPLVEALTRFLVRSPRPAIGSLSHCKPAPRHTQRVILALCLLATRHPPVPARGFRRGATLLCLLPSPAAMSRAIIASSSGRSAIVPRPASFARDEPAPCAAHTERPSAPHSSHRTALTARARAWHPA